MKLEYHPLAYIEFEDACAFLEKRRSGLGERLRAEVDACLDKILEHPHSYPIVYKNFRRAAVKVFPYRVYFLLDENSIRIWAIFDERKKSKRLENAYLKYESDLDEYGLELK